MNQKEIEYAIDQFAREVVANAFDQGVCAAALAAQEDPNAPKALSEREKQIAVASAQRALAAFFSNHELIGSFSIELATEAGTRFDLAEQFGAPLITAFEEDGWLKTYSKFFKETGR